MNWGLGIGDWGLGPIPNPQSPIPNPQLKLHFSFENTILINIDFLLLNLKNNFPKKIMEMEQNNFRTTNFDYGREWIVGKDDATSLKDLVSLLNKLREIMQSNFVI